MAPQAAAAGGASAAGEGEAESGEPMTWNRKSVLKMEVDEPLGQNATIAAVLYANTKHPQLKAEYPGIYRSNESTCNFLVRL